MTIGCISLVFFLFMSSVLSYIIVTKNSPSPVFVTGDINGLGKSVIESLVNQGIPVRVLVPKAINANLEGVKLVTTFVGESTDEEAVQSCMTGCIAAVSMVKGATDGDGSSKLDYSGNSNVVEQAGILGVERIILLSSIGCGDSKTAVSESFLSTEADTIAARNRAEKDLRMYTNLEWTIIRTGEIKPIDYTGKAILTTDAKASSVISEKDLSILIVKSLLATGGVFTRKEVSAVDPSLSGSTSFTSLADSSLI